MAQAIPVTTANTQKSEYVSYMTGLGVNMNSQTQSVSFDSTTLMHWLNTVVANADEFRIFMGRYPQGHPSAGRTTVMIWPYKTGAPAVDSHGTSIQPFNEGNGLP
jgi:hypothetical protein